MYFIGAFTSNANSKINQLCKNESSLKNLWSLHLSSKEFGIRSLRCSKVG